MWRMLPVPFSNWLARSFIANCKSAAAAMLTSRFCAWISREPREKNEATTSIARATRRIVLWIMMSTLVECYLPSHSQNHDFGGLDQSGGAFSWLEAHLFRGIGGDDRGDVLFTNGHGDLCEQAAVFDREHAADELVATTDFTEVAAADLDVSVLQAFWDEAVDLTLRDAVMTTRRLRGFDLIAVNPLLQRGV